LTRRVAEDSAVRALVITGTKPGTFITHFSVEELEASSKAAQVDPAAKAVLATVLRGLRRGQRALDVLPALRRAFDNQLRKSALKPLLEVGRIHDVFSRLESMDKAVIAAINGTTMGGGCELALACDYRLMARGDHVIGLIEVLAGIVPGAGGTQRLARTVGHARAVEMLLEGVVLAPDEAERIGLISRAVDAEHLMDEAMALARRLAKRPPLAVGTAKRAVKIGATLPQPDGLLFEQLCFMESGVSSDAREAARFFVERFRSGQRSREIFASLRAGEAGPHFRGE
jgi:enoyl-CoA hydratase